jgi:hypothetical protein
MTAWVFVEGAVDAALISRLLADLGPQVEFRVVPSDEQDDMRPLARKTLITRREPVALVIDAGTNDKHKAKSQLQELNDYLAWGAGTIPFKVIQFTPETESILFQSAEILNALVGRPVSPELAQVGKVAPRAVLQTLLPKESLPERIQALSSEQISELSKSTQVAELRDFVTAVASKKPAPA